MQRRPRPNRRRGLLRAVLAAIVLIVVLAGLILLISSLTAPAAKAPTVPITPTPSALTPSTSAVPTIGTKKTATPKLKPKPTSSKKKDIAVSSRPPGLAFRVPAPSGANAVTSPDGRLVAFIGGDGDAYARSLVRVWNRTTGTVHAMSYGDRFIRPVWSGNAASLLFARVAKTSAYPGARWSLVEANLVSGRVRVLDTQYALNLSPLGWRHGQPVYLVATASDTSIYTIARGHRSFVSILMPQVVTNPTLSPNGRYLGFAAPSDCFFCTYDDFDFDSLHTTVGPSGGQNERDMAWSRSHNLLAVPLKDRIAVLQPPALSIIDSYPAPLGLPRVWAHPMSFTRKGRTLTLTDTVTRETYSTTR